MSGILPSIMAMSGSARSCPALKARPAPVSTSTRTALSSWMRSRATRSSACIAPVKLFSLSGRFSVRRAMPASTVKVMFSKFMARSQTW
jgi:hypothetical protein